MKYLLLPFGLAIMGTLLVVCSEQEIRINPARSIHRKSQTS